MSVTAPAYRLTVIVLFSLLVSVAFLLYGVVFQQVGSPPDGLDGQRHLQYVLQVSLHPLFLAGLGLALGGALVRMFMFDAIGIAGTALAGQLTIVLTVVFSVVFLGDSLGREDVVGMVLIMTGVYLVQANEGLV